MGKDSKGKKPKTKFDPTLQKKPKVDPGIKDDMDENPAWQLELLDINGPWGWDRATRDDFIKDILPKIQNFETMCWKEILGQSKDSGNHIIDVNKLTSKAKKRLKELNLDDFETLISLRIKSKPRIWGVKVGRVCKILWWDPKHDVYPVPKKRT